MIEIMAYVAGDERPKIVRLADRPAAKAFARKVASGTGTIAYETPTGNIAYLVARNVTHFEEA